MLIKLVWCFARNANMIEWVWEGTYNLLTGVARGRTEAMGDYAQLHITIDQNVSIVGEAIIGRQISFRHVIQDNVLTAYFDAD